MSVTLEPTAETATGKSESRGRRPAMAMEAEAAGETRKSLFLCIYYFILITFAHLSFILFDHPF